MSPVARWRATEIVLEAAADLPRPFHEVDVVATFTGPRGERIARPAFWDGGRTWRVRFAPTAVGRWKWTTAATPTRDPGLHGQTGTLECVPYEGDLPIYRHGFLQVARGGRHLAHRDGTPFLWLADTHWLWESETWDGSNRPGIASMFRHMADRRIAQGFTVYQVELFERWSGEEPNLAHFQNNVDPKWRFLADRGVVVGTTLGLLTTRPTPRTGPREAKMARYVCARYGAYPAAWLMYQECTGHYAQWFETPAQRRAFMEVVRQVGRAYKAADPYHHPRTAHSDAPLQTSYRGEDWLDFTLLQGGHDPVIDRDGYYDLWFEERRPLPQIEGEADYEQLFDGARPGSQPAVTADQMREKAYQAMQCGCAGYTYGANGVWQAVQAPNDSDLHRVYGTTRWDIGLALPGAVQLGHWKRFYGSLPWHRMQPRPECDGLAQWPSTIPPSRRPALSADPGRKTVAVYFTAGTPFGGTLRHLHDIPYRAHWFDPRTGATRSLGTVRPRKGAWTCPPQPDTQDWLLVLKASARIAAGTIPFRWAAIRRARDAERRRNLAPNALVTASSTDTANKVYAPQNAVDRKANAGDWHHWSNDAAQGLPAWLRLEWPAPVTLRKVRLTFMRNYETADYTLEIDGKTLAEVRGNTDTVREHRLAAPTKVRTLRFVGRRGPERQPEIVRVVEIEAL